MLLRFDNYLRRHPRLNAGLALAGLVSLVIGASGFPGNVADWGDAFALIGSEAGRWILATLGFLLIVWMLVVRRPWHSPPAPSTDSETSPKASRSWTGQPPHLPTPPYGRDLEDMRTLHGVQERRLAQVKSRAEDELVAIIDEGNALIPDVFRDPEWDRYLYWSEPTAVFLETVFGPKERERFERVKEATSVRQLIEARVSALRTLIDNQESWQLRADGPKLSAAVDERRNAPKDAVTAAFTPRLSFGKAEIPRRSQPIHLQVGDGPTRQFSGRVIRVPVTNAHGAAEARQVHARLLFMPDDVHRSYAPKHPAQGEWESERGPEIEINLPGNGRPRYLDVVLVLDGEYPHAFEWTRHSRAAGLNGYEIQARPFDVKIDVMGSGPGPTAPQISDTIQIECTPGHMLRADWLSRGTDEATNWVPWDFPGSRRPPR